MPLYYLAASFGKCFHTGCVKSDPDVLDMLVTDPFLLLLCLHLGVYFFRAGVHSGATLVPSLPTCKNDDNKMRPHRFAFTLETTERQRWDMTECQYCFQLFSFSFNRLYRIKIYNLCSRFTRPLFVVT